MNVKTQSIFMIGIGGMGMAPLAIYLVGEGHIVNGYDDSLSESMRRILESAGVGLSSNKEIPSESDVIVHSTAISITHRLMRSAVQSGMTILSRGEMLANQAEGKQLIAVVGSHGKTTTSAMIAHILKKREIDAGYIGGGLSNDESMPPAWNSSSRWLIAEVDESDGSIEHFSPEITLLTNLDWDHTEHYPRKADFFNAFRRLFKRTRKRVLLPFEQIHELVDLHPEKGGPDVSYFGEQGDYSGEVHSRGRSGGELILRGIFRERTEQVNANGFFNMHNALAALAVCHCMGFDELSGGLSEFKGIQRRQAILYDNKTLSVLADYAHHPTEISALLKCAREWFPERQLTVVFQPHRYSRTAHFREAFARELEKADQLVVLPVYGAGEKYRSDGNLDALKKEIQKDAEFLYWFPGRGSLHRLFSSLRKPAVVLFIGAGSVDKSARLFGAICKNKGNMGREWMEYLKPQLSPDCRYKLDESLQNKTTLKIGGNARFYAEPGSMEDLFQLLESSALFGLPHYVLGRGSNLVVSDVAFPGLVIRLNRPYWRQVDVLSDGRIRVGGGARLGEMANRTCSMGFSGFEFLEGIPGSVGGALKMNAGAMGSWIFDLVEEITVMDDMGHVETLCKRDFESGYRRCSGLNGKLALSAILKSPLHDNPDSIRSRMRSFSKRRRATQPRESSAGCMFRNPEGYYAGQLIDEAGMKGKRIGGAEVSTIHGNFIINVGNARYGDVLGLVRHVRTHVDKAFKLELVPEVELLGLKWENII